MQRILSLVIAVTIAGAAVVGTVDAADIGARCSGAKLKAAAKKSGGKLKCYATASARGVDVDQACLDKAEAKFSAAWQRIEATGTCRTTADENQIEAQIDVLVTSLARQLAPCGDGIGGVCGGSCPFGLTCFEIGTGCFGEDEPCRCHGSTTTCPASSSTTTTTVLASCGNVGGVCGGSCPGDPDGFSCFEIGIGCHGEPEPCRCHGTTSTCPPPSSTTTTTLP
jgi:hypothetical protein